MKKVHLITKAVLKRVRQLVEIAAEDSPCREAVVAEARAARAWWAFRQALEAALCGNPTHDIICRRGQPMLNRHPGACVDCTAHVPEGQGYIGENKNGRFIMCLGAVLNTGLDEALEELPEWPCPGNSNEPT